MATYHYKQFPPCKPKSKEKKLAFTTFTFAVPDLYNFISHPASSGVQYKVNDYVAENFLAKFFFH